MERLTALQVFRHTVEHGSIQFTLSGHADEWRFQHGGEGQHVAIDGRYKAISSLAVHDALNRWPALPLYLEDGHIVVDGHLADFLALINDHPINQLDALLPWNWQKPEAAAAA